jgi:hypothetical protein
MAIDFGGPRRMGPGASAVFGQRAAIVVVGLEAVDR